MVRRLVLFSGLVSLVLMGVPALSAATSIAGPNGKIVFASGRANSGIPAPDPGDADARIWVADYPGGTPVQVTTLPTGMQHRHPNWSPDHSKIVYAAGKAFSGEYALWIVDLRTGEQTEFVPKAKGQDRPTWSPDGTRIAYGSQGDLWVKNVAPGSVAEQLANTAEFSEERPVMGFPFNRSRMTGSPVHKPESTIQVRSASSRRGSGATPTAWTTWSGCDGRVDSSARSAVTRRPGSWLTGAMSAASAMSAARSRRARSSTAPAHR